MFSSISVCRVVMSTESGYVCIVGSKSRWDAVVVFTSPSLFNNREKIFIGVTCGTGNGPNIASDIILTNDHPPKNPLNIINIPCNIFSPSHLSALHLPIRLSSLSISTSIPIPNHYIVLSLTSLLLPRISTSLPLPLHLHLCS